jgi:adenylate kinase
MRIVLLGAPGAGKGTQAKMLAQNLNLAHISTGDLLRQNVKEATSLGQEAKGYMERGELVPDELVAKMLQESFLRPDLKKGFILDGYPRNLSQARALDGILSKMQAGIDLAFYLEASLPVIIQRLSGRLVCSKCGMNFHIKNMPPKKEGICDICGGSLYQRVDDKEEAVIKRRLAVYKEETASLIDYYAAKGRLKRVSSDADAEQVLKEMLEIVRKANDSLKV